MALLALSVSPEHGEADRARAMLLTLAGWTSPRIAEAFGVRDDTAYRFAFSIANIGTFGNLKKQERLF